VFSLSWVSTETGENWGKLGPLLQSPELAGLFQAGDLVILAFDMQCEPCRASWEHDLDVIYGLTQAAGAKLLVMGDSPFLPKAPQACLPGALPGQPSSCHQSYLQAFGSQQKIRNKLQQMSSLAGFHFWDFLPVVCPAGECDMYIPGTSIVMYADISHLNIYGVLYVAPFLCPILHQQGTW